MIGWGRPLPQPSARSGFYRFPNVKPDTGLNTPVPFLLATGTGVTFLVPLANVAPFFPHVPEETAK
jgi:hypothetical protein